MNIGVVIVTKWRYYLFYLQQYFSSLRIILFCYIFLFWRDGTHVSLAES